LAEFRDQYRDAFHTCSKEFFESIKGLDVYVIPVYGYSAPAKSGAGIGVLVKLSATHDAPSVFFCVVSSLTLFQRFGIIRACSELWWLGRGFFGSAGFRYAGYANPVQSTTSEIGVSGGGFNPLLSEAAT
jgi:hypothetical protein